MENKQLQEEAEEYEALSEYSKYEIRDAFIAGATSKYVEQEKLKAIIDEFDTLLKTNEDDFDRGKGCAIIRIKIKDLEQQLKELEK